MSVGLKKLAEALRTERLLQADAKDIATRLRKVRTDIRAATAWLEAEQAEPRKPNMNWGCGCLEVDGVLWRDCKTKVEIAPGPFGTRELYPYEEAEAARQRAKRDAIVGADKEPCARRRRMKKEAT